MAVMANQACMVFDFFFGFIAWHFETTTAPRKRERNILVPFLSMHALIMVLELASLEKKKKKKERRKKMTIFDFFQNPFTQLLYS